jgi:hypothetical protein
MGLNFPVLLAQIVNWVLLFAVIVVIIMAVRWYVRKNHQTKI